jgi:hypothetical protein
MDLSLPLIGILGVIGFNLNKPSNSREYVDRRIRIPVSELNTNKSIYESRPFSRSQIEERRVYEKIRKNNELVNLNSKSDAKVISALKPNKKVSFKGLTENDYVKPKVAVKSDEIYTGPMFSLNKFFIPEDITKTFDTKENFQDTGLDGNTIVNTHQNMQPFFGGKIKQAARDNGILERHNGNNLNVKKQEVTSVQNGKENTYGSVLFTDSIQQDRFIASTNQTALLPFKQERVLPIPGQDNRPVFKTVDELNTVNPKTVLGGRLTPGKTIGRRALQAEVPKNQPDTYYNLGEDRNFNTFTGDNSASYYDGTDHNKPTRKNITAESTLNQTAGVNYIRGAPLRGVSKEDGKNTTVRPAFRASLDNDWIRGRSAQSGQGDLKRDNLRLREQERQTGNRKGTGNIGGSTRQGSVQNIKDALKTTSKELSHYQYMGTVNGNQTNVAYDNSPWYRVESKTRATKEHTPGGSRQNAPAAGKESIYFESSNRTTPESRFGSANFRQSPTSNVGAVTQTRAEGAETDFGNRLTQTLPRRVQDRPVTNLGSRNKA